MSDESSKTMMVDERQTVRQVLDSLLDKSHCGYSPDWSLVETITELQMGKSRAQTGSTTSDSNKHCLQFALDCTVCISTGEGDALNRAQCTKCGCNVNDVDLHRCKHVLYNYLQSKNSDSLWLHANCRAYS